MNILLAHFRVPQPNTNSGEYRLVQIIRILLSQGHKVTILASDPSPQDAIDRLARMGVPSHCNYDEGRLVDFFKANAFDCAILSQYWTYKVYIDTLRTTLPGCAVILDTCDLHFVRLQREAELDPSRREEADRTYREEWQAIRSADCVWVVTPKEQELLRREGVKNTEIVPNIHDVHEPLLPFEQRAGIVFLGYYRHRPNADAMRYFMQEVYPLLEQRLPDAYFSIAGADPCEDFQEFTRRYPRVRITGFIEDHRALLNTHRVGIAPLRYGAGMKGKICEYFACGLPCVTSSIGAEGMGLEQGKTALIADDPAEFAEAIRRLYTDRLLWRTLAGAGVSYVDQKISAKAIAPVVLGSVRKTVDSMPVPNLERRIRELEAVIASRERFAKIQQARITDQMERLTALRTVKRRFFNLPSLASRRRTRLIRETIKASGLFQRDWYVETYPETTRSGMDPLDHFLNGGWRRGHLPNPMFDPVWYLRRYPDVARAGMDPLSHYCRHGEAEGRQPCPQFDVRWYRERYNDEFGKLGPLAHYLQNRHLHRYLPHPTLAGVRA